MKEETNGNYGFPPLIAADMRQKQIDLGLTRKILDKFNAGRYDHVTPVAVTDLPTVDGKQIIDLTGDLRVELDWETARRNIERLGLEIDLALIGKIGGTKICFDRNSLAELGVRLYPVLSYGILNGGSASSYFDYKKNMAFNETLFKLCEKEFTILENLAKDKAKGLAPAYINQDGTPGPSFIELKMRSLLIEILRYRETAQSSSPALAPLFQMTSVTNQPQIAAAYATFRESPCLKPLIAATGVAITDVLTGVQPMLAAFSHSRFGRPKTVFTKAYGMENTVLPMPGGHGQNFEVLGELYRNLYKKGKRFIYLGNVDNLGYTVNPVALALIALENKEAGFEFSFRTAVDTKGGILIIDQKHRLNCADIGPAISREELLRAEKLGKKILFNCATGLFDLEFLTAHLDRIIDTLPVRFSDQDKDSGQYSQAEQVTWEIIGLLNNFLIFGVDKYDRFLAAKLALENLMAGGIALEHPAYPTATDPGDDLKSIARKLHQGLARKLETVYGLKKAGQRWEPKTVAEIKAELGRSSQPVRPLDPPKK